MASQAIIANQRAAGGSSGPDISGATATPDKVWIGETFFAGATKEMQTGTLTGAGMLKYATGTQSLTLTNGSVSWVSFNITGLSFTPIAVYYICPQSSSRSVGVVINTGSGISCAFSPSIEAASNSIYTAGGALYEGGAQMMIQGLDRRSPYDITWHAIGY